MPHASDTTGQGAGPGPGALVKVRYYTDPACPWSWAFEPSFRRLLTEFGHQVQVEYIMGGMNQALGDPSGLALQALEAAVQSGMPADVRLWLSDPPRSSHPAGMAVKGAAEQGDPGPYLRRLREGFFFRGAKLDNADALLAEARAVPGLDLEQFRIALSSHGVLELLGRDLELAQAVPPEHRASGSDRVELPSLEFVGADGELRGVYGYTRYDELRLAAIDSGAAPLHTAPSVEDALRRFGSMAAVELAEVCQLPGPTAPATLWQLASEWRVRSEHSAGGQLWSLA